MQMRECRANSLETEHSIFRKKVHLLLPLLTMYLVTYSCNVEVYVSPMKDSDL